MSHFHNNKDRFIRAIEFSSKVSGFSEHLIEKDYYCSLILKSVFQSKDCNLIFKGGTLLNKIHAGFYRVSEDLDFSISVPSSVSRKQRSGLAQTTKKCFSESVSKTPFNIVKPFKGQNENKLYNAEIEYNSVITNDRDVIKVEVSLQEPVLEKKKLKAKTLLIDPVGSTNALPDFLIEGLSLREAYGEKIRAALSRRHPAIRDVFDIYYAVKNKIINTTQMADMVKYKLLALNREIDLSKERKMEFFRQIKTDLQPVLLRKDFLEFNFEQAWLVLKNFELAISMKQS